MSHSPLQKKRRQLPKRVLKTIQQSKSDVSRSERDLRTERRVEFKANRSALATLNANLHTTLKGVGKASTAANAQAVGSLGAYHGGFNVAGAESKTLHNYGTGISKGVSTFYAPAHSAAKASKQMDKDAGAAMATTSRSRARNASAAQTGAKRQANAGTRGNILARQERDTADAGLIAELRAGIQSDRIAAASSWATQQAGFAHDEAMVTLQAGLDEGNWKEQALFEQKLNMQTLRATGQIVAKNGGTEQQMEQVTTVIEQATVAAGEIQRLMRNDPSMTPDQAAVAVLEMHPLLAADPGFAMAVQNIATKLASRRAADGSLTKEIIAGTVAEVLRGVPELGKLIDTKQVVKQVQSQYTLDRSSAAVSEFNKLAIDPDTEERAEPGSISDSEIEKVKTRLKNMGYTPEGIERALKLSTLSTSKLYDPEAAGETGTNSASRDFVNALTPGPGGLGDLIQAQQANGIIARYESKEISGAEAKKQLIALGIKVS